MPVPALRHAYCGAKLGPLDVTCQCSVRDDGYITGHKSMTAHTCVGELSLVPYINVANAERE